MKKTKLTYFFGVIAFGSAMVAHAAPVSKEMAHAVASGFLTKNSVAKSVLEGRTVDSVEAYENLWVANLSPSGHIIISGSTKCKPICSFSPGDFAEPSDDTAQMDMFESWIERCSENESDETLEENADWAKYSAETPKKRLLKSASISLNTSGATIVGPLIGSNWHQNEPYNDLTPLNGIPCGCSATAGGQELYYWKWPHRMERDFTYVHELNKVPNSYTNRMNGLVPFDWDKMRDNYKDADSKDITTFRAEDKASTYAAAHLVNWVQTFVHMLLRDGGSGAPAKLNASVLTDEWYEAGQSLSKWENDTGTFDGLWTAITNDIAFGSPINVNSPGHQMVVEGYALDNDNQEFICLNYGWGSKGSWVDLENEIDNGGAGGNLAHFQIGFRPKKRVQFDIVPKKSNGSVKLVWYLPHCYTNRIDGFTLAVSNGMSDTSETIAAIANRTVYTNDVSLAGYSGDVTFTVTPNMKDGEGEGLPTSVTTTIGTPHGMPAFECISAIGGGLELMQDGFFAECGMGITNTITVTCSEATTGLKAIPTHITVLPDERVSVVTNGNIFTVHVDATAMDLKWDGDMILLTLVASNDDGTEVAKNLMLRFNSTRNILDGTFNVVAGGDASDPVWLCGTDTVIDGNGKSITYKSNSFMGTGTVTLTNSVSGGSFTFEGLDYFNGTLKWLSTGGVTVNLPSNCNVEYEGAWRYAVRDSVTPSKEEPVPLAVWSGNFEATQTRYTLDLNGNALSADKSTITINQGVGVKVDFDSGLSNEMTVLFKYANLNLSRSNTLVTSYVSASDENWTGVYLDANGTANGISSTTSTHNGNANVTADQKTVVEGMTSGTMAFYCHKIITTEDGGTVLHYINGANCRRIYKCSSLGSSYNVTFNGCTIGGERAKTNATLFPAATGLQITGIAIFSGKLTREQMAAYIWPAEIKKYTVSADTTVSALNTQIAAAVSGGFRVMEIDIDAGTTISVDAAFSAAIPVSVKSEGNITLSAESMCDASYFNNIDFTGVKGAVLRSWLAAGVVGFNFYSTKGRNTSAALVSGAWYENLTDKDGTSTEMFADGLSALTWSSSNCYGYNEGTLLNGYLDDGANGGNGVTVTLSNVPYEIYDVIIYASTDTANADFTAKTVNGTNYTWDVSTSSVVEGSAVWGRSRYDTPEYGTNALYIAGLRGPLTIYGGARNGNNHRGGIAAIQVMPPYYTLTIDDDCTWSNGVWTIATGESINYVPAGGRVKIVANKAATLTIDSNVSIDDLVIIGDHKDDISFNIQPGVTFALYKELDMPVLNFTGGGTVFCSCSDSLKGTVKGSCVIEYAEGLLPDSGVVFTDSEWTGTNVFTNCGNSNNSAHRYVDLSQLGNNNSFLKMPGFNGYLADDKICSATLVIDKGTEFNISNGDSGHHNTFKKVVGEGTFKISGDQGATTQVVVHDVGEFAGAFDMMGKGLKSIVVGAPDDWICDYTTYRQKVVVAGPVSIASGKTWNVADSQGVVVLSSGTVTFGGAGSAISGSITLNSGATVKLPANATFPYTLASSGTMADDGSVCFYVGETDYTGSLSFSDGVVSVKSDVVVCATIGEEGDPVAWDDLDWNIKYPAAITNNVTVSANREIELGATSAHMVLFNISGGATLTLTGALTADEVVFVGNGFVNLSNATITGARRIGEASTIAMSAGTEGTISVPSGSILRLVVSAGQAMSGYTPYGVSGGGSVQYWYADSGELVQITSEHRITGNALCAMPSSYTNPVTGEAESYTNYFFGAVSSDWATNVVANWNLERTPYVKGADDGGYDPGFMPAVFDGNNVFVQDYTNVTCTAAEGWNVRWGFYNGVNATVSNLNKMQCDIDRTWITVDSTSRVAINGWGGGNVGKNEHHATNDFYVASKDGITFGADFSSTTANYGLTIGYYLAGDGSVSYQRLGLCDHVIKQADIVRDGTNEVKCKELVSFTSTTKTFAADALIKVVDGSGNLITNVTLTSITNGDTTLTADGEVGACELVQTSTNIVLYCIDGNESGVGILNVTDGIVDFYDMSKWTGGGPRAGNDLTINVSSGDHTIVANKEREFGDIAIVASGVDSVLTLDGMLKASNGLDVSGTFVLTPTSVVNAASLVLTNGVLKLEMTDEDSRTLAISGAANLTNSRIWVSLAGGMTPGVWIPLMSAGSFCGLESTVLDGLGSGWRFEVDGDTLYATSAIASITVNDETRYYASLAAATNAANGNVITLLTNTDEAIVIPAGQTVRIRKNGFTCDNVTIADVAANVSSNVVDGVTTYTSAVAKAAIGTSYYASLADAVTGAANNATNAVRLLAADDSAVALSNKTIIFEESGFAFSGTLTGNGTLMITNAPSATTWVAGRFDANSWIGTLALKNVTMASFDFSKYGTANSTVRVIGCSGGFAEGTFGGTLCLEDDGEVKAFTVTDAYSGKTTTIAKLTGSGTFYNNYHPSQTFMFVEATGFNGAITLGNNTANSKLVLGAATGESGRITISTNATIAAGKTWSAPNGVNVLGSGTLCVDGSVQPVSGALTLDDGAILKIPSNASIPYKLATSAETNGTVRLFVGENEFAGNWDIMDGSVRILSREAELNGGNVSWGNVNWGSLNYTNDTGIASTITVSENTTLELGSISAVRVTFSVAENKTLTLSGSLAANEIVVNGPGSVVCSAANTLTGTIKGNGTVVYGVKPNLGSGNLVATDNAWEGVIWLRNVTVDGIATENCAGTNSTLRLTGCTGYFNTNGVMQVCTGALDLQDDGETKAFTITDGFSANGITVFAKLTGSGTITQYADRYQRYVFVDPSEFSGTFDLQASETSSRRIRIILGDGASLEPAPANSTITVLTNVTIATGRTWAAPGGINVFGTLTINGGVASGTTIRAGDFGARTLVIDGMFNALETPVSGAFAEKRMGANARVTMVAGEEGAWTTSEGAILDLIINDDDVVNGYTPSGITGSGTVEYYEYVSGELTKVDAVARLDGNNLLPYIPTWRPVEHDANGSLDTATCWNTGALPTDNYPKVEIAVDGSNTLTINQTRTFGVVNVTGSGMLTLEGSGAHYLSTDNLTIAAGVDVVIGDQGHVIMTTTPKFSTITINDGGTFTLRDNLNSSVGSNQYAGSGTLELENLSGDKWYLQNISFAGTIKTVNSGGNFWIGGANGSAGSPPLFAGRPELIAYSGTQKLNNNFNGKTLPVRDLSGNATITVGNEASGNIRTVSSKQTKDTVFGGAFESVGTCKTDLAVSGGEGDLHSLTLTGVNTTIGTLTVTNNAKIVFSALGSWASGTVVVGENGYLESTNNTAVSKLTLCDGATLVFPTSASKLQGISSLEFVADNSASIAYAENVTPVAGTIIDWSSIGVAPSGDFRLASNLSDSWMLKVSNSGLVITNLAARLVNGSTTNNYSDVASAIADLKTFNPADGVFVIAEDQEEDVSALIGDLVWDGADRTYRLSAARIEDAKYVSLSDAYAHANEGDTVTLMCDVSGAINVPAGITLDVGSHMLTGTLSGSGTVLYTNSVPSLGTSGLVATSGSWSGVLWLKDSALAGLDPTVVAGAGATLRLTGCTGYFIAGACAGELNLADKEDDTPAFSVTQGSSVTTVFAALTGDGKLSMSDYNSSQKYVFADSSMFYGAIDIAEGSSGKSFRVILGNYNDFTVYDGTITVTNTTAVVAGYNTWSAPNGVNVLGSGKLCVDGTGTVVGGLTFAAGSTVRYVGEQSAAESIRLISADSFTGVENAAIEGLDGYYLEVVDGILYASKEPVPINTDLTAIYGPQAVAVWDGNFSTNALVAYSPAYTLVNSNATHGLRMSSVTIDQDSQGLFVDFAAAKGYFTVLVKYSNLTNSPTNKRVLFATTANSDWTRNRCGVRMLTKGNVNGLWNSSMTDNSDADYPNDSTASANVVPSSGTLAFVYSKDSGTFAYVAGTGESLPNDALWSHGSLKAGNMYGFAVGGNCRDGGPLSDVEAAKGMTIEAVAVFGQVLSVNEMNDYIWPSYVTATTNVTGNAKVSDLNDFIDNSGAYLVSISLDDGATVVVDEAFSDTTEIVAMRSEGSITLSAESQPSASSFTKVDFSGVKGSVFRSWLPSPGVVGFNFRSASGSDVSGALVACDSWIHDNNSASGSSTALFPDGLSKLSWSSANTWACSGSTIVSGYLDDGATMNGRGAEIYLSNIPYDVYDVIIYASSDDESTDASLLAKTVNGKTYTWDAAIGSTVEGNTVWGNTRDSTPAYGRNALRIRNLTGPLTIYGGARSGSNRGGISAIQIMPHLDQYTVTFVDEDGTTVLKAATTYDYGTTANSIALPDETPTKAADAQYTYAFSGWSPALEEVKSNTTYTATYNSTVNQYTVTFVDEDGTTVLKAATAYDYGTAADIVKPADPTKAKTAQYTYTFTGWSPAVAEVTGNATYRATYSSTVNTYDVTFVDEDGTTVLKEATAYDYGTAAAAIKKPDDPTKAATAQYTYTFAGWSPALEEVKSNTTYTATYSQTVNQYNVTFVDEDGTTVLKAATTYAYGTAAADIVKPADPTKAATAQYTYAFAGWSPEVENVTSNATYTATYNSTVNQYTVTFVDENGTTVLKAATAYDYGTAAADIVKPADPTKAATAQYTYTFAGWSPALEEVKSNTTYTATYSQTVNQYTVTFVDEDGTGLSSASYDYGTAAADIVKPADPTKAKTAQYTYTFTRWSPAVTDVTSNATYTATYSQTVNQYNVTFVDEDGTTVLKAATAYDYGTAASAIEKPADPTKDADAQFTYTFNGWSPTVADVTGDATYTATYSSTVNTYVVTVGVVETNVEYGASVTFKAPTDVVSETAHDTQVWAVGTTYDGIGVTDEFTCTVTNAFSFAWDILATNYWYETSSLTQGLISGAPDNGWLPAGTNFTLTAVADDGYAFTGWTGDTIGCSESGASLTVTMNRKRTIGATFEATTGYTISPRTNWFTEDAALGSLPQTSGATFGEDTPDVSGRSLNIDRDHDEPLFYTPPEFSGSAATWRIETVIKELAVNDSTNALPIYVGEGNIPYASIAAATSDEGPNYWYAWNGATWAKLNETIHPSDGGPYTNVIEFAMNDSKLNVAYFMNGARLGTVEHASATELPSLSKIGFSGYGKFESFSGDGIEASITLMTTKSLDELIDAGLVTNGFETVESALAHKDDSGLYGWQKMVLGMSSDSDEKLFAAPVQNASPTSLSFKLGNYRTNSNFSNMTAKFQVYEVSRTGEAVEDGLTSGEEFVDAASTASVDLSGVNRVKFFRIKVRFE